MNIKEIVKNWLIEHGYHGLVDCGKCSCSVNSLMPCNDDFLGNKDYSRCEPGYLIKGECSECSIGFCISPEKDDFCDKVEK